MPRGDVSLSGGSLGWGEEGGGCESVLGEARPGRQIPASASLCWVL